MACSVRDTFEPLTDAKKQFVEEYRKHREEVDHDEVEPKI